MEGSDGIEKGDTVKTDFENGHVLHEGNEYHFPALRPPSKVLVILEDGDLTVSCMCGRNWGKW